MEEGNSFIVLEVAERKVMGYKSFDEVKDHVKSQIMDKKYEEMVDKLVKEAKIEVNNSKYNSLWVS